jgi:hypothetical protein
MKEIAAVDPVGVMVVARFAVSVPIRKQLSTTKISVPYVILFPSVAKSLHGGFPVPVRIIREN